MQDTKKYQCPECDFRATRKENIKLNVLRSHKKEFNFKCSQCPKEYPIQSELNFHIQVAHMERTLKCPECTKFFPVQKLLKKHLEHCHNADTNPKKIFACDKCDYKVTVKKTLQDHFDVKHNGIKPCCTFCDFQTTSPSLLRRHTKFIHKNGSKCTLICDECSFEGKNWKDYREHLKSLHLDIYQILTGIKKTFESIYNNPLKRNVKCTECDKTFSFIQDMKIHVKAVHEGVKYKCDQCDFQSGYKNFLRNHIKRVHKLYRHKCSQCDKSFDVSTKLRHHIQVIHEGLRYVCELCNCKYSRKRRLDSHMKSHENAPLCLMCNKTFASEASLKEHTKKQHTDSFPCPFCELETSQEADLRKHISDNHTVKKEAKNTLTDKPAQFKLNYESKILTQSSQNVSPKSSNFKFKVGKAEVRYKPASHVRKKHKNNLSQSSLLTKIIKLFNSTSSNVNYNLVFSISNI